MTLASKNSAVETEKVAQKGHIVDESRLDNDIHLNDAIQAEIDKDEQRVKQIIRKVDFRMVPILGLLYMWALIDRVNLPNVGSEQECISGRFFDIF